MKKMLPDLLGKLGPAIFAATLVGCLLAKKYELIHSVLMLAGVVFMVIGYYSENKS